MADERAQSHDQGLPTDFCDSSVSTSRGTTSECLHTSPGCREGRPRTDATDRRTLSEMAVLWESAPGRGTPAARVWDQSQARATADASEGAPGCISEATHQSPGAGHKIYPYLLNGLTINRPNQVWASDICYVPMAKGFMYLTVIMDWYSRRVLPWRVSNTLDAAPCIAALEEALARYGVPEIFNTDQGAQYTSEAFTAVLRRHEVQISMDGKDPWVDNVFVERLWRSVKYEDIYLWAYETPAVLRTRLTHYFQFYNAQRRHQRLNRQPPDAVYFGKAIVKQVA